MIKAETLKDINNWNTYIENFTQKMESNIIEGVYRNLQNTQQCCNLYYNGIKKQKREIWSQFLKL